MHEFDEEWPVLMNKIESHNNLQNYGTEKHSRNIIDRQTLSRNLDVRAGFSDSYIPMSDRQFKDVELDEVS